MSLAHEAEFRRLFEAHRVAVHRLLYRLTRNAADADDLLQETFLTLWRKRGQFDGRGHAGGWVRTTAVRTYLNSRTKHARRDRIDAAAIAASPSRAGQTVPSPDGEVARRDAVAFLTARVAEALSALPDEPREAFVLFRHEGLTCAEIGTLLGVPAKTVETRVRRATELLAQRLAPWRDQLAAR